MNEPHMCPHCHRPLASPPMPVRQTVYLHKKIVCHDPECINHPEKYPAHWQRMGPRAER